MIKDEWYPFALYICIHGLTYKVSGKKENEKKSTGKIKWRVRIVPNYTDCDESTPLSFTVIVTYCLKNAIRYIIM